MPIVIIEDDAVVADTLALYLEQAGYDSVIAKDGVSGLAKARDAGVALVILDLMVPGLSGLEICRQLRKESAVPILMVTARGSENDRVLGLDTGADDYVTKPFSPREVVARVQALLRRTSRGAVGSPAPIAVGELEVDAWAHEARLRGAPLDLTPTEFKVLEALAKAPGRAFTREEILARVFGPGYEGTDRTVDVHITNLRRKLEPGDRARYVLTAPGVGYKLAKN
jgi:two-component system alkaline phosphatase synthesis response regulator PhoP